MSTRLPIWSIPLVLALLGIVLYLGRLPLGISVAVAIETGLYVGYMLWRDRRADAVPQAVSNVLSLFPGHLLLLLAIALSGAPDVLAVAWTLVPAATIAYDVVTIRWPSGSRVRSSILIVLYCILWADLLYLLERVISHSRGFSGRAEIIAAAAFGLFGILFISVGVYRHWRAGEA